MVKTLENICSEFSDDFIVVESKCPEQIVAEIDLDIQDLGDLCGVLEDYEVTLSEIQESKNPEKCKAVFVKSLVTS